MPPAEGEDALRRLTVLCITVILLLCALSAAAAEDAKAITEGITFSANAKSRNYGDMQDDDFSTYFPLNDKKGWLEVHTGEPVYGICL